ncbi:tail tape measure protein, partial [Bacteroides cellulosilyticus]
MFNEIGQQSEGVINTTLSGVSYMVEHYERFGRILLGLVGTYGVYRTAVMTVTAVKGWAVAAEALHYNWLLLVEKAQKMLNRTMLSNPYVLVATLLAGVAVALISMKTETERLQESEERYQQQKQKTIEAEEEHRRKIEELCSIAGDEAVSTDARREALNKLEQKYPDIFSKYDTEYEKLKNIKKIKEEIARLEAGESISNPANELKRVDDRIKELEGKTRLATEYYQDSYGRQRARYVRKSARSRDEEAELQNLYGKRKSLNGQIRKDEVNAYFENLTGVSNETLAQQIKQRRTLLARMSVQEKEYGKITQGDENLTGTYSRDELKYQLNKLVSEQNRRNLPMDSSTDWVAAAKEKYQDALKAYNAFLQETSNSLSREEFEKKAKELKDAVDTAKKEYDKVKPGEDKDSEAERKKADKAEKEAQRRKQVSEKLGQELAGLQRKNDEAEIEMMTEGLEKKLRQIDNEY